MGIVRESQTKKNAARGRIFISPVFHTISSCPW
jgi:hypothetical protein